MQAMTAEHLIVSHREFVRKLAREIHRKLPSHVPYDDLVGYGEIGLVEAAGKYDPLCGAAFTTFAYYRVRGAIFDGLKKMSGLPPALRRQASREAGMDDVAEQAAGAAEAHDPEAAAKAFSTAVAQLGAVFLASSCSEDDQPIEAVDHSDPARPLEQAEMLQKLSQALASLPADQQQLIRLFYFEQKTMTEIAASLGKDKATVSRHHAKAIAALAAAIGPP